VSRVIQNSYTSADVERLNRVVERLGSGAFPVLDQQFSFQLAVSTDVTRPASKTEQCLYVEWGGAHFEIRLPGEFAARLYRHALAEEPPLTLPAPLATALVDMALEAPITHLETLSGRKVRLVPNRPQADLRYVFDVTLESQTSGELVALRLATDSAGLILLALLARRAPDPVLAPPPDDLPIVLRFELGYTDVRYGALRGLAPHDLILLDQAFATPKEPSVAVRTGTTGQFMARLAGTTLTVQGVLENAMPDHIDPAASAAPLTSLDDLGVRLTFDVGEKTVTLGELRGLKAGHVFQLGREPQRLVTIRANGRPIGHGELVTVDDRVGVAVHELLISGVRMPAPTQLLSTLPDTPVTAPASARPI
jgi:type III secretion protein Q